MAALKEISALEPDQKTVLLRAWRERWPEIKWSIIAKKSAFESKSLAELMVQQATLTPCPNILILSYFKHALCSQMIPIVSGMEAMIKMEDMSKIYCIKAFIELIDALSPYIWIQPQDPLVQAHTALRTTRWLVSLLDRCLQRLSTDTQVPEHATVVAKISSLLCKMGANTELRGLLYVAQHSKHDLYTQITSSLTSVTSTLAQVSHLAFFSEEVKTQLESALTFVKSISSLSVGLRPILNVDHLCLNPTIHCLMVTFPSHHLTSPNTLLIAQISTIMMQQGVSLESAIFEMLKSVFVALTDTSTTTEYGKLAAFTFLKLPNLLSDLCRAHSGAMTDLDPVMSRLLEHQSLLDYADGVCGCETFVMLCQELKNNQLLTEVTCRKLEENRRANTVTVTSAESHTWCQMLLKATSTLQNWMEMMDQDYSRNMENLIGILSKVIAGRSIELIVTAAAATGKLPSFTQNLLKFNEIAKQATGENGRQAQTRALLFDMTFLMLCYITVNYGFEVLEGEGVVFKDSYFCFWARANLPRKQASFPCPETMKGLEEGKVESLINQVYPSGELRTNLTRWNEVCQTVKFVSEEVLHAWNQGVLTQEQVKAIITAFTSRMCCLGIAMATHLSGLMPCYEGGLKSKAASIIEMIFETTSDGNSNQQSYVERSALMTTVLNSLSSFVLPNGNSYFQLLHPALNPPAAKLPKKAIEGLYVNQLHEQLHELIKCSGRLNHKMAAALRSLLMQTGHNWFMLQTVLDLFHLDRPDELSRSIAVLYGLMSLDINLLTKALIYNTIPWLLGRSHLLTETRILMLGKLTVMSLFRWKTMNKSSSASAFGGKKRKRSDSPDLSETGEEQPIKLRRLTETMRMTSMESRETDDGPDDLQNQNHSAVLLPRALNFLWKMFQSSLAAGQLAPGTVFVECVLQEIICSGQSKELLQTLSSSVITQLVQIIPRSITMEMLLLCCNLDTAEGCITAARLICQGRRRGLCIEPA